MIRMKTVYRRWALMFVGILIPLLFAGDLLAQDTQWRGLNRDGKYMDTGLLKSWPEGGPELILQKEGLGNGYSTPILYEGAVYISGRRDTLDVLTRLDLEGNIAWETVYGRAWNQSFAETRSTPTIEDGRIYIMGGLGTVVCMDCESGEILWGENTHQEFEGEFHRWGMTESLLVTDRVVISSPIGPQTVAVALDKKDGSLVWKTDSLGGVRSYVSPLMIEYQGQEMILITSDKDMIAVDPANGDIIWSHDIVTGQSGERGRRINTNTPLYKDGEIYTTSGYNTNAQMLKLSADGKSVELKWSSDGLDTHHGGVVLLDGYIYGANWYSNRDGKWVCVEWETGEVMWIERWYTKGSIITAEGMLYIYEEKSGNVGLVKAGSKEFELNGTFQITEGEGPHWAHPSIFNGKLMIRHGDFMFVYDIKK